MEKTDQPAVVIKNLVKYYGSFKALHGVDMVVGTGEIFGFLGPNGAGKTTAIRCMLDILHPNSGEISILGMNPQKTPVKVRSRVGYLPGELNMYEYMTGRKMLRFLSNLKGQKPDWDRVNEIAERLKLDLKSPIKNLSMGNKQKMGIVMVLMHKPDLLILDEPTIGLDPLIQQEVLKLLLEARDEGATVLFSSHILHEVQAIADKVGIIRNGKMVEVANTNKLIDRSMRQIRVRFKHPVDTSAFGFIPGVTVLSHSDGIEVLLQLVGEIDHLIKALSAYPVSDMGSTRLSLEEIFLAYYSDSNDTEGEEV